MSAAPASSPTSPAPREPMPEGIHNVYVFDMFNAISWIAIIGSPMLLFFQQLNVSATVLAIVASLPPLLNILQIPAARFVERVGYRRFVLGGWTTRSFLIIGMALVAMLTNVLDHETQIAAILFLSFGYNTLRGISSCGMLPWFTHIVPAERRGEFWAKDQMSVACASIFSMLLFSTLLRLLDHSSCFGIIFSISAISAFVSLYFMRRIPDVPVEKIVPNDTPLPWKEMFFYPPVFKYLRYNIVINVALGASNAFWVRFFRAFLHINQSYTLLCGCASTVVLVLTLLLITPLVDRTGNKLLFATSGILFAFHFTGWAMIAAGIIPATKLAFIVQCTTSGLGAAFWNLTNVRYIMGIVPVMGRAHFLALFSVSGNLTIGLVPLLWGPVMDYLNHWHLAWGPWIWNSYSLFYSTLAVTILIGLVLLRRLDEPKMMSWDVFISELLVKTPSRAISRVIGRLRGPGIS
jgi:MFS family permease